MRGSTKEALAILSNLGSAYVIRINDVPASTGYGEPVQRLCNFRDGERVVGAMLMSVSAARKGSLAVAVTKRGYGLRSASIRTMRLSTRAGRRFAKPGDGDESWAWRWSLGDVLCVVTSDAHPLLCRGGELPELADADVGVIAIKTREAIARGRIRRGPPGTKMCSVPRPTAARRYFRSVR